MMEFLVLPRQTRTSTHEFRRGAVRHGESEVLIKSSARSDASEALGMINDVLGAEVDKGRLDVAYITSVSRSEVVGDSPASPDFPDSWRSLTGVRRP